MTERLRADEIAAGATAVHRPRPQSDQADALSVGIAAWCAVGPDRGRGDIAPGGGEAVPGDEFGVGPEPQPTTTAASRLSGFYAA